jgi:hypothetical protein
MKRWASTPENYQFDFPKIKSTKFQQITNAPMLYDAVLAVVTIYTKKKRIPYIDLLLNYHLN